MKAFLLAGLTCCTGLVFLSDLAVSHGGVYRGPGAVVPPGAGSAVPNPYSPPAGLAPATQNSSPDSDQTGWELWWGFNRDRFLDLKQAVHGGDTSTGNDDFFLGHGEQKNGNVPFRPSESAIRQKVVPALLEILEKEKATDLLTSTLMALAKIGDEGSGSTDSMLARKIEPFLSHPTQEVSETAAIALGVLGHPASTPLLADLLGDTHRGRRLVDETEVPYRTRAFAAYGLGLTGFRNANEDLRRFAAQKLVVALEEEEGAPTRDIPVACILSLGLLRLTADGTSLPTDSIPPASSSREAQIAYLRSFFRDKRNHEILRAYVPVVVARLVPGTDPLVEEAVESDFLEILKPHSKEKPVVQQSAAIALGLLGDNDDDPRDVRIRDTLRRTIKDGERLSQRLALISLARVSARDGANGGGEALDKGRKHLTQQLARGTTPFRPWAGIALGVLERSRLDAGHQSSKDVLSAVRSSLAGSSGPSESAALCIAAGLMRDLNAQETLLETVTKKSDDRLRGSAALGLGMMRARDSIPDLRAVALDSKYRPGLLQDTSTGLGLMGDKELVPALVGMLGEAKGLSSQSAIAAALGFIGDSRSVDPLVDMLGDDARLTDAARAFAAAALGIVCDKEPLPWSTKLAADVNWWQPPATLWDPATGNGVLDIL